MLLDVNGKPFSHIKGIVTQNIQSEWKILCDDNGSFDKAEVGDEICQIIGFRFVFLLNLLFKNIYIVLHLQFVKFVTDRQIPIGIQ